MLNSRPDSHNTSFMPISPAERYAQAIESGQFMQDEAQAQAVRVRSSVKRVAHTL